MRLLIVTQVVDKNDSNLGFFHRWIEEFAKHCESIIVICLKEGLHQLPPNVAVYSLGKPSFAPDSAKATMGRKASEGEGRRLLSRIRYALRFRKLIREHSGEYETVFVHMNPEYVLLGGFFWRTQGKKIALWYVHKSVTWMLRIALHLSDVVFTASQESFRIVSPKVRIVGHGIDTSAFRGATRPPARGTLRLLTLGRITASKRIILMLDMCDELTRRGRDFVFRITGEPLTYEDHAYAKLLQKAIDARPYKDRVHLSGAIPHEKIPEALASVDVLVNLSTTGSMDKAVLEAFAAGCPVVTSNDAYAGVAVARYVRSAHPAALADAVEKAVHDDPQPSREYVEQHHSLPRLIERVLAEFSE